MEVPQGKEAMSIILKYAYEEYRHLAIDRQNIQISYIKIYLTLSSIIISALVSASIFLKVASSGNTLPFPKNWTEVISLIFLFLSFILSLYVFMKGIDLLRGRIERRFPFAKIEDSFTWLEENRTSFNSEEKLEVELLKSLIKSTSSDLEELLKNVKFIGKNLRCMSRILIGATSCALIGVMIRILFGC